jgi:glutamine amidotransferase
MIINDSDIFGNLNKKEKFFFNKLFTIENCSLTTSLLDGYSISTSIEKENFTGIQFLPEKSGTSGERVLINFINN